MSDNLYHELILDLYRNPLNKKKLDKFDIQNSEHNPFCGDSVEIFIKLGKDGKIENIGWQGEGCAISEACVSLLTDFAKNKTPTEIKKITKANVLKMLGLKDLNPTRLRCALLPLQALQKIDYVTKD